MNDLLNYALGKCFQENIQLNLCNLLSVTKAKRKLRSNLFQSDSQVIEAKNNTKSLSKQYHLSGDLHIETELEYSPNKARLKSVNDVQLPAIRIDGFKRYFFEHNLTNESDCTTSKRKQSERLRSFTFKHKQNKKGCMQIEVNNQQLTITYKKLVQKLDSDFTRYHLSQYLSKYLGYIDYVNKLLSLLNFPSIITLPTFKNVMASIAEMQQIEILQCSFQTFDLDCKEFVSITDLFNMFKSDGVIQQDADVMFKSQAPLQNEKSKQIKKVNLNREKQKPILITMFKDSPTNRSKVKRYLNSIITFEEFTKIFNDQMPSFFKEFVRLMFYDFT